MLLAHEMFHYLKLKKKDRKVELTIKVDMTKAYNRLSWPFLKKVMWRVGFFFELVFKVVTSIILVKYDILLNGGSIFSFVHLS